MIHFLDEVEFLYLSLFKVFFFSKMQKCHSYEELLIAGVLNQNIDLVKEALDLGADINYRSGTIKMSALMTGAIFNQFPITEFLVNQGADVLLKSQEGKMAVDYAIEAEGCSDLADSFPHPKFKFNFGSKSFFESCNKQVIYLLAAKTVEANPKLAFGYKFYLLPDQIEQNEEFITGGEFNLFDP